MSELAPDPGSELAGERPVGEADAQLSGLRCQFRAAPPRRFLYPALLLLLAEQPRHGYRLVEGLQGLGLGRIERSSVYHALAELARDELVRSWDEPPAAGSTRHVYELTPRGIEVLEAWMSTVAAERTTLDTVLRRYWYCNAHRLSPLEDTGGPEDSPLLPSREAAGVADGAPEVVEFVVATDRSSLTVQARSNVGPIAFSTTRLRGSVKAVLREGLVSIEVPPSAHLEVELDSLSSGNPLYDSELLRRVEARRYPLVTLDLLAAERLGEGNCYQTTGELTLRGVTKVLSGQVTVTVQENLRRGRGGPPAVDRRMTVSGDQVLDIRHFAISAPAMAMLKIYPDVRLHLHLEADSLTTPGGSGSAG